MCRGPLAYGQAGATKIVFGGRTEDIVLHHTNRFLGDRDARFNQTASFHDGCDQERD